MTRLFDRAYRLQVDTLEIRELQVTFSIERTLRRRPGRAEIKIYNLSREHRRQLEQRAEGTIFAELHAGYVGATPMIFRGELFRASSERKGADLVTMVKSRDGHSGHGARVSRSHRPGVGWGAVVRDLVGSLGVGEGNLPDFLGSTMGGVSRFEHGATISGHAGDELDRLMTSAGLEWSVQDGALQVLRRGEGLTRPAVRVSAGTGLVGSPVADEHGKLKVIAKITAGLTPGALISLESEDHTGTFRIEQAAYKGDFHGKDWHVEMTVGAPAARRAAA